MEAQYPTTNGDHFGMMGLSLSDTHIYMSN